MIAIQNDDDLMFIQNDDNFHSKWGWFDVYSKWWWLPFKMMTIWCLFKMMIISIQNDDELVFYVSQQTTSYRDEGRVTMNNERLCATKRHNHELNFASHRIQTWDVSCVIVCDHSWDCNLLSQTDPIQNEMNHAIWKYAFGELGTAHADQTTNVLSPYRKLNTILTSAKGPDRKGQMSRLI